jgi:hypothetical protein
MIRDISAQRTVQLRKLRRGTFLARHLHTQGLRGSRGKKEGRRQQRKDDMADAGTLLHRSIFL